MTSSADPTPIQPVPSPAPGTTPAAPDPSLDTPAANRPDATVEELEADRAATRERLAASVEELAAKADVRARAKEQANETAQQLRTSADEVLDRARELPPAVIASVAIGVAVLAVLLIRHRRRSG